MSDGTIESLDGREDSQETIRRIKKKVRLGEIPSSAGLHIVRILHDDDCLRPAGGKCTCRPEIDYLHTECRPGDPFIADRN